MGEFSFRVVLFCCIFRLLNVLLIQSQFDPDEYWQNLEPAYCQVFDQCDGLTWEWKRRSKLSNFESLNDFITQGMEGPVRSYVSILPTMHFYYIVKFLGIDSTWMISRGPLVLNALFVALSIDWSVWYLSRWMEFPQGQGKGNNQNKAAIWYLYASLTSWFGAYALIRNYSNSLETISLVTSLRLVSPVR